jgi:Cd2+/Zn2+-exporting ATPase
LVKAGEKVALDGEMRSASGTFNTAALTGEPKPQVIEKGQKVLAGMIAIEKSVEIEVKALSGTPNFRAYWKWCRRRAPVRRPPSC